MQSTMRHPAMALAMLLVFSVPAAGSRQGAISKAVAQTQANPIRKVVNMLQAMQKKVTEEGEKEEKLYEKFMCYCKSGAELQASITTAQTHGPAVTSNIEASEGKLSQTKSDLQVAQTDNSAAKDAMAEATALREKESTAFAGEKAEYDASLAAIKKAISSIEGGMAGSFLQTETAAALRKLLLSKQDIAEGDRQELLSFLSGAEGAGYVPKSGEIVGILKEMAESFEKNLAEAQGNEDSAIKSYNDLMAAKTKEVEALQASIESKTRTIGNLGVEIVQMKEDLSDTQESLAENQQLYAALEESCSTKTAEWEERKKTRAEELLALADTIKALNDDDALDLFKKTIPTASTSFMQVRASAVALRSRAADLLQEAVHHSEGHGGDHAAIDLIAFALAGKKSLGRGGFDKIVKMIDNMVQVLKQEQVDDDHKKEYCGIQLDSVEGKKKEIERAVSDAEHSIETAKDSIATLVDEIAALEKGIKDLDQSVAEATEQRQAENRDFKSIMASDGAAKELLDFAKNRLNQFYNPKLAKATPTQAPEAGAAMFAQVEAHVQHRKQAPGPPPETWGAYQKEHESNSGVLAMIDLLIKDLEKEMTEAKVEEKNSQAAYEKMMVDSSQKRTADTRSLGSKTSAKADLEGDLTAAAESKDSKSKELMATLKYKQSLHSECDWLLQYFDVRKEARANEGDSLKRAKAVLSGADYSLLQTKLRGTQN